MARVGSLGRAVRSPRALGMALLVVSALALAPAVAGAAPAPRHTTVLNPKGRFLGVVPNLKRGAASPLASIPLTYHGGPVMHSDANYSIYWEPSGFTTPTSYKNTIDGYFGNVAADSGLQTNPYSVDTQYTDGSGHIAYNATFGQRIVDTNPYPASGCPQTGGHPCLTDAQLTTEINSVVAANSLPRGMGTIYFLFTPPNVASCFTSGSTMCSTNVFCAYHSSFGSGATTTLYANQPYAAVSGCDPGQRPNADPADATINVVSHEDNESITDPLGNAWFDSAGNENGDKCNFNFGASLGGASGTFFNAQFSGGHYWMQQEWSNLTGACAQRQNTASDFFLNATALSPASVAAGSATTSTIGTLLASPPAQSVALTASGLPAGATAAFSPSSVTAGSNSTLTISTTAATPPGTYPITVTGTATSATHQTSLSLVVTGASQAAFTYPTNGQSNVATTQPFTWSTAASAQGYFLTIGTSIGAYDLVNSGALPSSQTSYIVPALPTGQTLYARIYTKLGGAYSNYQDITFTAAQNAVSFTNPTAGQSNVDTTLPFAWSTIGSAQGYFLTIGTSKGGYDVLNSGALPSSQSSYTVPELPTGQTLYARIYTKLNGSYNNFEDVSFTAAPNPVAFTYPTAGQSNVDTTLPFTWSTAASAQGYYLTIGTTKGGYDLLNSGALPSSQSSYSVPELPTGQTLWARIYTKLSGNYIQFEDVSFTAAPNPVAFTYPTAGQSNVDTTLPFTWSTAASAQGYYLMIGTTKGGYDLVNSGALPSSQSSYTVPALPTGQTLWARIYTRLSGSYNQFEDVSFTAAQNAVSFTYPTAGQTNVTSALPFTWSTVSSAQAYYLTVGTTKGGSDVVNSGVIPSSHSSYIVPTLPGSQTLFARIYTELNGYFYNYEDVSFTSAPGGSQHMNAISASAQDSWLAPFPARPSAQASTPPPLPAAQEKPPLPRASRARPPHARATTCRRVSLVLAKGSTPRGVPRPRLVEPGCA